jgi:hypothetical protein
MTEQLCLLTRLRKWHAANLPEDVSEYDTSDIKDMVPEAIDRIEELETTMREIIWQAKQYEIAPTVLTLMIIKKAEKALDKQ